MATAARQKKAPTKTASRSTAKAKAKKPSRWNNFFTRRYAKPAVAVLLFALVGGGAVWWASAATTTYSLWSDSTVPHTITEIDPKSVELGVRFHAKVAGYITGVRFYKGAQNTGTHIGSLWDAQGHLLAQATFTNESKTGWQSVTFAQPVSVGANVTYIASYFAPKGYYSVNDDYFQSSGRSHSNLVAPQSTGSNPNGVYLYNSRGGFPTQTYRASNYWVDVMFNSKLIAPKPAPSAPTNVSGTLQGNNVALTWQASSGDNPITSYNIIRDGGQIGTASSTTFTDTNTTAGKTYKYQVQAVDSTGALSALSATLSVTIPNPPTGGGSGGGSGGGGGGGTTPTPPPPSGGFPTASSTGSAACSALTQAKGDVTVGNDNQVYQNTCVKGTISVTACNVTLKNVEVDSGEPYTGDSTPDLFAIWAKQPENCTLTLDHVSVITDSAPNVYVTTGVRVAYGGAITMTNSKLLGMQIGILGPGSNTNIQGNYMEMGPNMRGDHNENIEISGGNNLTMNNNTMLDDNDQTAVIACFTDWGADTNMMFSNNLMAGGGFTVYACGGLYDQSGKPTPAKNISFVNNVFWKKFFPNVGNFGEGRDYSPDGGGQWSGNVYMDADGTLTTQQVPQPPRSPN